MAAKYRITKPALDDVDAYEPLKLTRSRFREIVAEAFKNLEQRKPDAYRQLLEVADTAPRIAWGAWWAADNCTNMCGCPLATIATPFTLVDYYNSSLPNVSSLEGFTRFDSLMHGELGEGDGVAEITED